MNPSNASRFPKVRRLLARGTNVTRAAVVAVAAGALLVPISSGAHLGRRHHDPAEMKQHVGLAADWLLYKVEATDEQKARVQAILDRAIDDLEAAHPDREALHAQVKDVLTAETIDRDAIERLRAEQLERFDLASRRISSALADVAEALTVEQRTELAELAESFHGRRQWAH